MEYSLISERRPTSKKVILFAVLGVVALCGTVLYMTQGTAEPMAHFRLMRPIEQPLDLLMYKTFQNWKAKYQKNYLTTQDEFHRLQVFTENFKKIKAFQEEGEKSFQLGLTKFADLTQAEFKAMYLSTKPNLNRERDEVILDVSEIPDKIDWRTKGAVTGVKDQGQCGSCWAFSAVGSLEGLNFIKNGQLLSFAEQQLVDCSKNGENQGCNGGLMSDALNYTSTDGIEVEADYPYKARDQTCKYDKEKIKFQNAGYKDVPANDEDQLAAAVAQGPVSVAVEADSLVFQFYWGGIIDSSWCGTNLDHGITAVGYDTTGPKAFWIVKNSWGKNWGESGYLRIKKADKGTKGPGICGIAQDNQYAI